MFESCASISSDSGNLSFLNKMSFGWRPVSAYPMPPNTIECLEFMNSKSTVEAI